MSKMATASSSIRDWNAPADNTKTLPFECTIPECIMRFATLKEMKLHKEAAPDHFYCKKCDVDCKDWDDLTQVSSSDSACCSTCIDTMGSIWSPQCPRGWMGR